MAASFLTHVSCDIGDAVVNVYINQEKRFAFVEMRTVEEASNAMALDGIIYEVTKLGGFIQFLNIESSAQLKGKKVGPQSMKVTL